MITASPIIATRMTARKLIAQVVGAAESFASSTLTWDGISAFATHTPWTPTGFGDRIEVNFMPFSPGTGNQRVIDTGGDSELNIANGTGILSLLFLDSDGVSVRGVQGPALSPEVEYQVVIEFKPDGVDMTVNGVLYQNVNTPDLLTDGYEFIASSNALSNRFNGVINTLNYTNATPLQNVNAVPGDGASRRVTIPTITLTGDFDIEFWWRRRDRNGTTQVGLFALDTSNYCQVWDSAASVPNRLQVNYGGENLAFNDAVPEAQGQDIKILLTRSGTTLECFVDDVSKGTAVSTVDIAIADIGSRGGTTNTLPADSYLYGLTITDKSGPSDVIYGRYDMSGNNGDTVPNAGTGGDGTWVNYDQPTDQVALPQLSRSYDMDNRIGDGTQYIRDQLNPAGPELHTPDLANPAYDATFGGWRAFRTASETVSYVLNVSMEPGNTYALIYEARDNGQEANSTDNWRLGLSALTPSILNGALLGSLTADWQTNVIIFSPSSTSPLQAFGGPGTGFSWDVRNISVVNINTGAVLSGVDTEDWS